VNQSFPPALLMKVQSKLSQPLEAMGQHMTSLAIWMIMY